MGLAQDCSGGRIFELFGPEGILRFPGGAPDENGNRQFVVRRGTPMHNGAAGEPVADENIAFPADALTQGFKKQMDEFIAVARGEKMPRADGQMGMEALNLALAILQSARTMEKVCL